MLHCVNAQYQALPRSRRVFLSLRALRKLLILGAQEGAKVAYSI